MPLAVTPDIAKILQQPGYLLYGVTGSADPTNTVAGSVFTDDWSLIAGWTQLGATDNGSQFHDSITTEPVMIAESYYEVSNVTTARAASIDFALAEFTAANLKRVLNGATSATTGTAATTLTTITPPTIGSEVRAMIGWQSQDATVRLVGYQAFQTGSIEPEFRKGAQKALLTATFKLEQAPVGYAYRFFFAGVKRAGT